MIAASVWITPGVVKSVAGASISRFSAATTPVDSDSCCASPNGDPIAASGSPTLRVARRPNGSTVSGSRVGSTFSTAMSSNRSNPTSFAGSVLPSWKWTKKSRPALTLPRRVGAVVGRVGHDVRVRDHVAVGGGDEAGAVHGSLPTTALTVTTPGEAAW